MQEHEPRSMVKLLSSLPGKERCIGLAASLSTWNTPECKLMQIGILVTRWHVFVQMIDLKWLAFQMKFHVGVMKLRANWSDIE